MVETILDVLDVSVIICAYTDKRWHDIVAAVESVQHQSIPPREIIVVVDHNPSLQKRVQAEIPGIIVVENSQPQGLSGARNSGIAVAQGKFVAFLDDDAVAEPDWLPLLYHCCEDSHVLGAGGTVEPKWLGKQPAWFPKEFYWVVGCTYRGLPEKRSVVRNSYGGCTCFRQEVFATVGGFASEIGRIGTRPMGCEETELCIRAKQYWPEKVFLYEPQAQIHHKIPSNRTHLRYFFSRCYSEGLSKSIVAKYRGPKDSLSSERAYTLKILPLGIVRGIADVFFRFDITGGLRAFTILAGFVTTAVGYLVGTVIQWKASFKMMKKSSNKLGVSSY